ncbi:MAG: hypothetical protein KDA62_08300 [Planctomycetales bacterium]|nr:hypothetical protein [Planctomycetales bacterium]
MRQVASWGLCFGWLCVSATFFASSGLAQEADNSPTSSAKSPKVGVVEKALDAKVSFEFIDTPLNDVAAYIADAQDINVLIDELALSDEGIAKDHPVTLGIRDVSLRSALRLMFKPLALTFVIEDEFLVITTLTTAETNLPVRVYPVQDLVGVRAADGDATYYDTQQLIDLIEQTIAMDSWASVGGPGEARGAQGKLVVSQTQAAHREIETLLKSLRTLKDRFAKQPQKPVDLTRVVETNHEVEQQIARQLDRKIEVDFVQTPLTDAATFLAEQVGAPIVIDTVSLEAIGIEPDVAVTLSAKAKASSILQRMLRTVDLVYTIHNEVIQITTVEVCEQNLRTRIYPIYDLLKDLEDSSGVVELRAALMVVHPESWDEVGGPGAIALWAYPPALVVSQTSQIHQELESVINELRSAHAVGEEAVADNANAIGLSNQLKTYRLIDEQGLVAHEGKQVIAVLERELRTYFRQWPTTTYVEPLAPGTIVVKGNPIVHRRVVEILGALGIPGPDATMAPVGGGGFF